MVGLAHDVSAANDRERRCVLNARGKGKTGLL
jgi:hypothetical protein